METIQQDVASMELPTKHGTFRLWVWNGERGRELVALSTISLDPQKEVLVRIHSECLTGDVFHSQTCDCEEQKDMALAKIQEHGNGVFIYHRQEGRNEGLFKKTQGYNLMREGLDTHEAYLKLVGHPDSRDYSDVVVALDILLERQKSKISLLTNNPYKTLFLERCGYSVVAEPLRVAASLHSTAYMETKVQKFLHNSVGFGPYVGATLFRKDIAEKSGEIAEILQELDLGRTSRKVFIGLALIPERGDLKDITYVDELNRFYRKVCSEKQISLVLHLDYPQKRQDQRDLTRFLARLDFAYSLQFRMPPRSSRSARIDLELLDSFRAEYLIFQLKEAQLDLLEQRGFAEYFRARNKFLLVDESWGSGRSEDMDVSKDKILKLVSRGLSRVALAGGYSGKSVSRIRELEDYFKIPISVDAESNLRTDDTLDAYKLKDYLGHFFPKIQVIS